MKVIPIWLLMKWTFSSQIVYESGRWRTCTLILLVHEEWHSTVYIPYWKRQMLHQEFIFSYLFFFELGTADPYHDLMNITFSVVQYIPLWKWLIVLQHHTWCTDTELHRPILECGSATCRSTVVSEVVSIECTTWRFTDCHMQLRWNRPLERHFWFLGAIQHVGDHCVEVGSAAS